MRTRALENLVKGTQGLTRGGGRTHRLASTIRRCAADGSFQDKRPGIKLRPLALRGCEPARTSNAGFEEPRDGGKDPDNRFR